MFGWTMLMSDLTVVVIAQNEEANIATCLQSVRGWAREVYVVDGGSSDRTVALARESGAVVQQHKFINWADQRNWALENLPHSTEWILFLDADELIPDALRREVDQVLCRYDLGIAAYAIRQEVVFLGRCLVHAHGGPHLIRLVRSNQVHWICEGAREYCIVDGETKQLYAKLWHEDRRGLGYWIEKQNRNAQREVIHITAPQTEPHGVTPIASRDRVIRTYLRTRVYPAIPYQARPVISFLFWYIVRGGFLDGYPGFAFCFLRAFWYPLLIDAMVYERNAAPKQLNMRRQEAHYDVL